MNVNRRNALLMLGASAGAAAVSAVPACAMADNSTGEYQLPSFDFTMINTTPDMSKG